MLSLVAAGGPLALRVAAPRELAAGRTRPRGIVLLISLRPLRHTKRSPARMLATKLSAIPRIARAGLRPTGGTHARLASSATSSLLHTPLYNFHVKPEHKGKMTGFAGFDMPLSYDGPVGASVAGGPGESRGAVMFWGRKDRPPGNPQPQCRPGRRW